MQRIILHLDLDYFYAQVEESRDLSLKTNTPPAISLETSPLADSKVKKLKIMTI